MVASIRKFLVAALTAAGGIIPTVMLTAGETRTVLTIVLAICNAVGVYLVPNARVVRNVPANATNVTTQ